MFVFFTTFCVFVLFCFLSLQLPLLFQTLTFFVIAQAGDQYKRFKRSLLTLIWCSHIFQVPHLLDHLAHSVSFLSSYTDAFKLSPYSILYLHSFFSLFIRGHLIAALIHLKSLIPHLLFINSLVSFIIHSVITFPCCSSAYSYLLEFSLSHFDA